MTRPSPKQLIARLKSVLEADSDDDLSFRLRDVHQLRISPRVIQRYSAGQGMSYIRAVELLDIAGYLTDPPAVHLEQQVEDAARDAGKAKRQLRARETQERPARKSESG